MKFSFTNMSIGNNHYFFVSCNDKTMFTPMYNWSGQKRFNKNQYTKEQVVEILNKLSPNCEIVFKETRKQVSRRI